MNKDVLPALKLFAASPVLKVEDRPIVDLFVKLASDEACGMTILELLAASQYEGSMSHFQHPLAVVLTREFVGGIFIGDDSHVEGHTPYEFDAWTTGDEQQLAYYVHLGDVEIVWNPARVMREYERNEEQRRREHHAELEAA